MMKKYSGFQMLAVPGRMKLPFGRQAKLPSFVESEGAQSARTRIGIAFNKTRPSTALSCSSLPGSHGYRSHRSFTGLLAVLSSERRSRLLSCVSEYRPCCVEVVGSNSTAAVSIWSSCMTRIADRSRRTKGSGHPWRTATYLEKIGAKIHKFLMTPCMLAFGPEDLHLCYSFSCNAPERRVSIRSSII